MPAEEDGPFNVVIWFDDGFYEYFVRDVPAQEAVLAAKRCIDGVLGRTGLVVKVQITDQGDYTNFLWERDKGIVYPTQTEGRT
jgi:hypothetical protein